MGGGRNLPPEYGEEKDILPANCYVVGDDSENSPEQLVHDFALYLQRGDLLSAMSYFDLYDSIDPGMLHNETVKLQGETAKLIQKFYYDVYLHDENELAWIYRHLSDEPDYLLSELRMSNMIFADFGYPVLVGEESGKSNFSIDCSYDGSHFTINLALVQEEGWKIESMNWLKNW